jgi:hypothetical protein
MQEGMTETAELPVAADDLLSNVSMTAFSRKFWIL